MAELRERLVRDTRGLTVERLEQINAAALEAVWRLRRSWDRTVVARAAMNALADVRADLKLLDDRARENDHFYGAQDEYYDDAAAAAVTVAESRRKTMSDAVMAPPPRGGTAVPTTATTRTPALTSSVRRPA
jgi:hypothetical protein